MNIKTRFTLTELVVVMIIAVICIVMIFSLKDRFLPPLSGSREKARRISCTSNLKQIGLAIRIYSQDNKQEFPPLPGRTGFEMLRSGGYLENVQMYNCRSTIDSITDNYDLRSSSVSYKYACGLNEATSVDSGLAIDRESNHTKYGNILFVDGHAAGFAGSKWSVDNAGSSNFTW